MGNLQTIPVLAVCAQTSLHRREHVHAFEPPVSFCKRGLSNLDATIDATSGGSRSGGDRVLRQI